MSNSIKQIAKNIVSSYEPTTLVNPENLDEVYNDVVYVIDRKQAEKLKEAELLREQRSIYLSKRNEKLDYIKEFGGFYFSKYTELLEKFGGNSALLLRFLYLCSFADNQGYIKIGLTYANENDLREIFNNLSNSAIDNIKEQLCHSQLIALNNDKIKINDDYYLRNNMKKGFKKKSCRVFDSGIKELYRQIKPRAHKPIGKILLLLDYLHYSTNILCINPSEKDNEKIKPLSKSEIGNILIGDIKGNTRNYNRQLDKIFKLIINGKPLLGEVKWAGVSFFTINPGLFYKGSNKEDIEWLGMSANLATVLQNDEKYSTE